MLLFRKIVIAILALGFTLGGLFGGYAGVTHGLSRNNMDDVYAGLFLGGLLLVVGIILWVVLARGLSRKAGKVNVAGMAGKMAGKMLSGSDE